MRSGEGKISNIPDRRYVSFYEDAYLKKNPSHHIEDSPAKFNKLMEVFHIDGGCDKILDIGCGMGEILKMMGGVASPRTRIGCDISMNILSRAKKMNSHPIEYVRCDGLVLPFRDSCFDLAIITDLVEHVPDPVKLLAEIRRVSKRLLIIIPIESGIVSDIVFRLMTLFGFESNVERIGHIHRFDKEDCRALLERCSFRIENLRIIKVDEAQISRTLLGRMQWNVSERVMRLSADLDLKLIGEYEFIAYCT